MVIDDSTDHVECHSIDVENFYIAIKSQRECQSAAIWGAQRAVIRIIQYFFLLPGHSTVTAHRRVRNLRGYIGNSPSTIGDTRISKEWRACQRQRLFMVCLSSLHLSNNIPEGMVHLYKGLDAQTVVGRRHSFQGRGLLHWHAILKT